MKTFFESGRAKLLVEPYQRDVVDATSCWRNLEGSSGVDRNGAETRKRNGLEFQSFASENVDHDALWLALLCEVRQSASEFEFDVIVPTVVTSTVSPQTTWRRLGTTRPLQSWILHERQLPVAEAFSLKSTLEFPHTQTSTSSIQTVAILSTGHCGLDTSLLQLRQLALEFYPWIVVPLVILASFLPSAFS